MDNFIMLKNDVVREKEKDKKSLVVKIGNSKVITVLCALDQSITRNGICKTSIEELCNYSGVKAVKGFNKNKETGELIPKSIEQIKSILLGLQLEGYINSVNIDINNVKNNELIKCTYLNGISSDCKDGFFKLDLDTYKKILNLKNADAMLVYCNIKSRIGENTSYCYPSIETIEKDTGLANNTITKILELLEENNLLFKVNIGQVRKDGKTSNYKNYYILKENNVAPVMEQAKEDAKKEGYKILTKFQDKKVKRLNGLKGQLQKQLNEGKEVKQSLLAEIEELENKYKYDGLGNRKELLAKGDKLLKELNLDCSLAEVAEENELFVNNDDDLESLLVILENMKNKDNVKVDKEDVNEAINSEEQLTEEAKSYSKDDYIVEQQNDLDEELRKAIERDNERCKRTIEKTKVVKMQPKDNKNNDYLKWLKSINKDDLEINDNWEDLL